MRLLQRQRQGPVYNAVNPLERLKSACLLIPSVSIQVVVAINRPADAPSPPFLPGNLLPWKQMLGIEFSNETKVREDAVQLN